MYFQQAKGKQVQPEDISAVGDRHLPFGIPYSPEDQNTLRLLYNKDYVAAFDLKYRLPMWSAFTLKGPVSMQIFSNVSYQWPI